MTRLIAALVLCLFASPVAAQCVSNNDGKQTCQGSEYRASESPRGKYSRGGSTTDRRCLTSDTRSVLEQAESHFGVRFKLVSTCRPGARIAGTNHISEHAHGRAVDLLVPRGTSKQAVVNWFYANAKGVTMVYRGMAHVHFDTGHFHKLACGGCRKRHASLSARGRLSQ